VKWTLTEPRPGRPGDAIRPPRWPKRGPRRP